jgi:hypothetical protein
MERLPKPGKEYLLSRNNRTKKFQHAAPAAAIYIVGRKQGNERLKVTGALTII